MSQGRGRPHKTPDERKTAELRIRLTQDERELLDSAGGGKTSTWARGILLKEAVKDEIVGATAKKRRSNS